MSPIWDQLRNAGRGITRVGANAGRGIAQVGGNAGRAVGQSVGDALNAREARVRTPEFQAARDLELTEFGHTLVEAGKHTFNAGTGLILKVPIMSMVNACKVMGLKKGYTGGDYVADIIKMFVGTKGIVPEAAKATAHTFLLASKTVKIALRETFGVNLR